MLARMCLPRSLRRRRKLWDVLSCRVRRLGTLPPLEMAEMRCCEAVPGSWTYPQIQPKLLKAIPHK